MSQLNLLLFHVEPEAANRMQVCPSKRPSIQATGGISAFSLPFCVLIVSTSHIFWRKNMFVFEKNFVMQQVCMSLPNAKGAQVSSICRMQLRPSVIVASPNTLRLF